MDAKDLQQLKIFYISPKNLTPQKNYNKCKPYIKSMQKSFDKFGIFLPIVVAGIESTIIDGNVRYWAAKDMNIQKIPCIRAESINPIYWEELSKVSNSKIM